MPPQQKSSKHHILSFKYALSGLVTAFKTEPKLKIHFIIGIVVVIIATLLRISTDDWIIIIFLIGFVISLELTNTAIEAVVNAFTDQEHPGAKLAKDISAGAVLMAAITSVVLGTIIFLPYLLSL